MELTYPVKGQEFKSNSDFGMRAGVRHKGIDLKAKSGTAILSVLPGTVVKSDDTSDPNGYGGQILIKHNVDGCIIAEVEGNWHFNIEELQKTGLKRMDDLEEIDEDSADVRLYFTKSHKNEVVNFTKTLKDYIIEEVDDDMSPIYLVVQTRNGFDLEEFDIKNPKMDLELNYGKTFTDVNKRIVT